MCWWIENRDRDSVNSLPILYTLWPCFCLCLWPQEQGLDKIELLSVWYIKRIDFLTKLKIKIEKTALQTAMIQKIPYLL